EHISPPFSFKTFGGAKLVVTIQVEHEPHLNSLQNSIHRRLFAVTQNRILLTRAIEEAEGYTELGILEHALRALQRRGSLVHANGRACFLLGEAFRDLKRYEEAPLPIQRS